MFSKKLLTYFLAGQEAFREKKKSIFLFKTYNNNLLYASKNGKVYSLVSTCYFSDCVLIKSLNFFTHFAFYAVQNLMRFKTFPAL